MALREKLYMSAYYLAHAVYQSYISLYYRGAGMDAGQVGALLSAVAAVSIPAQLLFGALSDRVRRPLWMLRVLLVLSAALLFAQVFAHGFWTLLPVAALFGAAYTPVQPLGDAAVLRSLGDRPFGPVRLMGAAAFALSALAFGLLLNARGREKYIVAGSAALMLVACGASFLLRDAPRKACKLHPFHLLKNRELMALLAFTLPAQMTMGYYYAFFPLRFLELPGGSGALLGWANVAAAAAEMPFLLASDRLFRRLGAGKLIALSTLALAVRWVLMGFAASTWLALLSQLLHGLGYICISVSMALYASRAVERDLRASAQALTAVFSYGLSRVLGNALGGWAAQLLGLRGGFLLSAALCALSLAVFFPLWKRPLCKSPADML